MIIEDEEQERKMFLDHAKKKGYFDKIKFVASTNSSVRGLEVMQEQQPEGIILDLELTFGIGSGLEFLQGLQRMGLAQKPFIIVTTRTQSDHVYNLLRGFGVDFIYCKGQIGYSYAAVLDTFLMFKKMVSEVSVGAGLTPTEAAALVAVDDLAEEVTQEFNVDDVKRFINAEFDAIGMGRHLKGRLYLATAVFLLVKENHFGNEKTSKIGDSVLYRVADEHEVSYSSVLRAMQTAIQNTWYDCDPAVLAAHYTAHISKQKAQPNSNEFIYYYRDTVIKLVEKSKPVKPVQVDNYY